MKFKDAIDFKDEIYERELKNEIIPEVVFSCNHCKRPTGYDTLQGIEEHLSRCLYKDANKSCVMCKRLKLIQEAQYPKNNKLWKSVDTEWAFGNFRTPYCMKKEKVIDEATVHNVDGCNEGCFELGLELPEIENTEEYVEWLELSTQLDEEYRIG